jgi:AraC family transcriptional regulator, transcriptional activator FtrA
MGTTGLQDLETVFADELAAVLEPLGPGGSRRYRATAHDLRSLGPLLAWAQERLGGPLTVADLATRAAVSPATLHRRFRAELGTTPLAWLTEQRVTLACRILEAGGASLAAVARASGLGTATNLRTQIVRHTGLNPSTYRRTFGT